MNTNNLKRFAKEARIKLLDQIGRKLAFVLSADTAELRGKQREIEQLKKNHKIKYMMQISYPMKLELVTYW